MEPVIQSTMDVPASTSAQASSPPPMPEVLVEVKNLGRSFGAVHAVQDLSFNIYKGQVVGFIGANGAGKTTTMRMMGTLDVQDAGTIKIKGVDTLEFPETVQRWVGWMPDHYGTYAHMSVLEYLDFFARAYGLKGKQRENRLREVMEFADLLSLADRPMNSMSKGMGQRLCFGRMLIPDPEFLILDEPAAGLDPKARIEFKNLVRLLKQRGKTIFISSHILSELGEMCDTLLFIDGGKLVYHGSAETLQHRNVLSDSTEAISEAVYDVSLIGSVGDLRQWVEGQPHWSLRTEDLNGARLVLQEPTPERAADGLRSMIQSGLKITGFNREARRLEDAFVDILTQPKAASHEPSK